MVKIVTDSACDIPTRLADDLGITFVPARILFGNHAYRDKFDLDQAQFYEMLTKTRFHPLTTQGAPLDFYHVFRDFEKIGEDILCINVSRKLSALIKSAEIAASYITDVDVRVIGSGVSAYQGTQVIIAAQMAQSGYSIDEIIDQLDSIRDKITMYSIGATLDYLNRGGRVTGVTYRIGSLLRVLPIVEITNEDVVSVDTQPLGNMSKAIDNVITRLRSKYSPDEPLLCFVLHAQNISGASTIADKMRNFFNIENLVTTPIGATIGANIGPGALGVTVAPSFSFFEA